MDITYAVGLGVLQGLTEFLPVSSSGHLVLAQSLIPNFSQPGVFFDVVLHLGTLTSVVVYFFRSILKLSRGMLAGLFLGSVPAGVVGIAFFEQIEGLFSSVLLVGFALLVTAALNFLTDKSDPKKKEVSLKDSFLVGIAQAIAIIPGISRSGATIFASSRLGIRKEKAAEFSFLLSVPAILGANALQFIRHSNGVMDDFWFYAVGFFAAAASGLLAIKIVYSLLLKNKFVVFSVYCLVVGVLSLVFLA